MGLLDINDNINNEIPHELYNEAQLTQLKAGEKLGLDISWYANPEYNWMQMKLIRNGLEEGLDVSKYANPIIDWEEMEEIRLQLMSEKTKDF